MIKVKNRHFYLLTKSSDISSQATQPKSTSSKIDKSDPLRYRQTVEILTTPIKFWFWLCIASATGFLVWSVAGRIPEKVTSNGILINPFELDTVNQPNKSDGTYTDVYVKAGDSIKKGDVIARVSFEDLEENVLVARESLNAAKLQYNMQYKSPNYSKLKVQLRNAEINSLKYYNEARSLVGSGVISESSVNAAQQKYESALQTRLSQESERLSSLSNQQSLALKLKQAIATRDAQSIIKSPYSGEVLTVYVRKGLNTDPGTALLELDISEANSSKNANKGLAFISYFRASEASKILVGQPVHILPDTIKQNTVGNLLGKVSYVARTPTSSEEASSILGAKELATDLVNSNQNIQVITELIPDSSSPSGFKWINGSGPPKNKPYQFPRMGVLGTANVITKKVPPITIGIPALKKFFGIE